MLFGLVTLFLFGHQTVAEVAVAVLTWLVGLAMVWLLWRPACRVLQAAGVKAALARCRLSGHTI